MAAPNPGEYTIAYYIMQAHGWEFRGDYRAGDGCWWQQWQRPNGDWVRIESAADARGFTGATVGDEEGWEG